jgi:hypothetical protein
MEYIYAGFGEEEEDVYLVYQGVDYFPNYIPFCGSIIKFGTIHIRESSCQIFPTSSYMITFANLNVKYSQPASRRMAVDSMRY